MKKRIVVAVLFVFVVLVLLSSGVVAGVFMSNMRGPGPDWNIQSALFRKIAGFANKVAGENFNNFGEEGKTFLWGSSFDEGTGLQEIGTGVGGGASVTQDTAKSNTGSASLKLSTAATLGNSASIFRYGSGVGVISKTALLFSASPTIPASGSDLSSLIFSVVLNYWGLGNDVRMVFILKISREAGGVQKLYYWDPTGAYVDTGITIDKFFFSRTDSVGATSTIWRSIKMVVNPTVSPPVYDCIEIDGHHFDLSAFQPQLLNTVGTTLYDHYNMNFFYVGMQTDEAVAKILNVDDVLMSSNE